MKTISITVSMYDRSRLASVTLPDTTTVGELMEQCSMRWILPATSFVFRNVGSNELLLESDSLWDANVRDGAELQIFPVVEGGAGDQPRP
ncbi:MAG: hypothetical protein BGO25_06870 [Acidobacteriales bacterium 59-55]|jgi:hypothetical protein|nr:hypothetical protein [Terriglobales bacterium]OJV43107.1 MAG: hypothetical protein BGO25_06870 [Acidobacteriales bacterium 59-55]